MPNTSVAIRPATSNGRKAGLTTAGSSTTTLPMIEEARSGPVLPPTLRLLVSFATAAVYGSDGQFSGVKLKGDWVPEPLPANVREIAADYLAVVEDYLRPGDQEQIALRLAALRGHWSDVEDDQGVKLLIATDWQRSIGLFPLWAVTQACEDWIDNQRRRPMIADIKRLCGDAVEEYVLQVDVLRKAIAA